MEIEKQQFRAEPKNEKEWALRWRNDLQMDLAKDDNQEMSEWVKENSPNFEKALESMPKVLELYGHDPEAARKMIKEAMRQEQTYH